MNLNLSMGMDGGGEDWRSPGGQDAGGPLTFWIRSDKCHYSPASGTYEFPLPAPIHLPTLGKYCVGITSLLLPTARYFTRPPRLLKIETGLAFGTSAREDAVLTFVPLSTSATAHLILHSFSPQLSFFPLRLCRFSSIQFKLLDEIDEPVTFKALAAIPLIMQIVIKSTIPF